MNELRLLSTKELATALKVSPATITDWRKRGRGPRFTRLGKSVYYPLEAVREWVESNMAPSVPKVAIKPPAAKRPEPQAPSLAPPTVTASKVWVAEPATLASAGGATDNARAVAPDATPSPITPHTSDRMSVDQIVDDLLAG